MPSPGGSIRAFWLPVTSASTPHSSIFCSNTPTEVIPSTTSRAPPARHLANLLDGVNCTGRGFAGLGQDRLRIGMRFQGVFDLLRFYRTTPRDLHLMRNHAERAEHLAPTLAEFACVNEDGLIARAEQVDYRGLHRAGPRRSKHNDLLLGP